MDVVQPLSAVSNPRRTLSALRQQTWLQALVLSIFALALGLRLYGLNWDRGYSYTPHPDERAILSKVDQISFPALGDVGDLLDAEASPWNPRWFNYGSFPLYLLKGVQSLYSLGPGEDLSDLRVAGRAVSAVADVFTVAMVFLLGSRLYGRRTGVLAALLAALAVMHIQLSHFFAVDTFLALFTIVAIYFMYRVARNGRLGDSLLAGAFVGLGLATKVSLAPILGAYVVAHLMYVLSALGNEGDPEVSLKERWDVAIRGFIGGGVASLVVLFIAQPYAFLDWGTFYDNVIEQSEMVRRIRDYPYTRQYIDTTPYWYHVKQLATWGFGWPLGVVAWAGLLYVSLRGMRWRYGLAYLGAGWALPIAILLVSMNFLAVSVASAVALAALIATLPFRSRQSRVDVLLLSWVVPYFLITGAFQVKFLRYMIPITPFLLLFGSRMLFDLWDRVAPHSPALRPWLMAGLALLVGSTAFYALSYMAVYREPHTTVRASHWINLNVPRGSTILKEHWEEGLPDLDRYRHEELRLYEDDTPQKIQEVAQRLAAADYLVLYSNRLYGTIPRLPERYPLSTEYYYLLFSGKLGYELAHFETTYPELLGVGFVDDTFSRPGIPEPAVLAGFKPSPVPLGLGFADESFSVYDHPKVLIYENVRHLGADAIKRSIEVAAEYGTGSRSDASPRVVGLMLSPEDAEAQQSGGTWSDVVSTDSWTNRLPVLAWLIVVQGIALLTLPISFLVFRPLPDRGYLFAKVLGLLAVALVVWLLASLHWMAFSRGSIMVAILALALVSGIALTRRRRELTAFVRERWRIILIGEALFLAAFFAFLVIRMANPDLWHPHRGGEKPMDLAYLNAVLRSSYMPPYDPWFGGGFLNYYYWGQFIVAMLIRATGIGSPIAFNLAVPMFFALTVAGAFSMVYNLAEGTRRRLAASVPFVVSAASTGTGADSPTPSTSSGRAGEPAFHWSPVLAGVVGALFVAVIGNLDGAIQVGRGAWRALVQNTPFGQFDFWRSTRMMPPDPPGFEITEFPFFTFLFADLHAHLMALPFTLLALGLALALVAGAVGATGRRGGLEVGEMVRLAVLGVAVGSLRLLNTWDFPTYLVIGMGAILLAEIVRRGGFGVAVLIGAGLKSFFIFAVGYLVFLPFNLTNEAFFNSLESTSNTTVLWQFLAVSGLFVFIIGSFFLLELRGWLAAAWRAATRTFRWLAEAVSRDDEASAGDVSGVGVSWIVALVLVVLLFAYTLTAVFSGVVGSAIPFVALLLALVIVVGLRWVFGGAAASPYRAFVAMIVGVSLALVIGLDVFKVEGDIDRMNSVFKFYLQVWVILALGSAYLLWLLGHRRRVPLRKLGWPKKAWLGALALLVVSASIYPVLGTQDRLRDRFNDRVVPMTLDGTAFIDGAVYHDREGDIDLATDYEGITWLRDHVEGSPIVLEGQTPTYRWGGRVSIYTGLPSVVGWQWHQEQQRWDYRWAVNERIQDVNKIYSTTDPSEAMSLLRRYGVRYVYLGQLERLYYPASGLAKFEGALGDNLEKVFQNEQVAIYRVEQDGLR